MKKEFFYLLLLFLFSGSFFAQNEANMQRSDKINALRVAFLTEKMDLSSNESERFWPIYNDQKKDLKALRQEYKPSKKPERMNNNEALEFLERQVELEGKILALKEQYIQRYIDVIPATKLVMLRPAEGEFNKMVLNRVKNQMQPANRKRKMN